MDNNNILVGCLIMAAPVFMIVRTFVLRGRKLLDYVQVTLFNNKQDSVSEPIILLCPVKGLCYQKPTHFERFFYFITFLLLSPYNNVLLFNNSL
jgi:hypothetical protein